MSDETETTVLSDDAKKVRNGLYRVKNTCDTLIGMVDDGLTEPDKVKEMIQNVVLKHFG